MHTARIHPFLFDNMNIKTLRCAIFAFSLDALCQLAIVMSIFGLIALSFRHRHMRSMPPGPNSGLFGFSIKELTATAWKTFEDWSGIYGPIFSFYLGNTPVIVLNKAQMAWDLLERRGDIYSSRPRSIVAVEILSGNFRGSSMPYGDAWRRWRKIQHLGVSPTASATNREFQCLETVILLKDLYGSTNKHQAHIERFTASIVFNIAYGRRVQSLDDPVVQYNITSFNMFLRALTPGRYLVDRWTALLYLPRRLQWFRWEAEKQFKQDKLFYVSLLRDVEAKMRKGTAKECMATRLLSTQPEGRNEAELAYSVTSPFSGGIDTTTSALQTFIFAMLLHPEAAKKAQQEIDAIVGQDRMPAFYDEGSLQYVRAIISEVFRWRPIAPLGLPHTVTADDVYEGFFIPKGTTIYPNIYAMTRDPAMFPSPELFLPERFLPNSTQDPHLLGFTLPFGFGRRQCPGIYLVSQSLFIAIARMLWSFNILPTLSPAGQPVLPNPDAFSSQGSVVSRPKPFDFRLEPRSTDTLRLLEAEAAQAEMLLKEYN